jgi:hypothetical protein
MEVYHFLIPSSDDSLLAVVVKLSEGLLEMKCIARLSESSFGNHNFSQDNQGRVFQLPKVELTPEEEEDIVDSLREYYSPDR